MKTTKLFTLLILSISIILPIQPIKSFNHNSHKTLVFINNIHDEPSNKISYFQK
ncbi:hypothetical protein [Maledivibacter halophilus]|uniref:Uncharacterized protein n=1 Tax=Maledivibacter halophilus TaxID=36842 RepID=A0A1T5IJ69_9FIRM|nr:hypothetical protein [Maledivibacter halophilus]SKC39169.1 hypothetical protein SAMN02194393_00440 [Maledivibacter halophilus]